MRKKVDSRIKSLVESNVKSRHRSLFVLVGDRAREQVVNLHYLLTRVAATTHNPILYSNAKKVYSNSRNRNRSIEAKDDSKETRGIPKAGGAGLANKPSVLWCYNKELGFTSHRKKRLKIIKKKVQQGNYDPNMDDPFELFLTTTTIRYCYYKETASVLGQTYGMCILQDYEALTPDILCRTVETVAGGGIICILLHTMSSLKQLYEISMDAHQKYRKKNPLDVFQPIFNERLILSLADCTSCIVVDDELNVLPISMKSPDHDPNGTKMEELGEEEQDQGETPLGDRESRKRQGEAERENELSISRPTLPSASSETSPTSVFDSLINQALTSDQANAVRVISECIADHKALRQTVALTAGRGRGKSAALGLCVASAIAQAYSNIFIAAPKPENVATLFEFIQRGLEALGMKEHVDFELVQSEDIPDPTNYNTSHTSHVVRVNVFRDHRQTVQYVEPEDAPSQLGQAELLVVDEAAAIPLPVVKKLLGPYLVLLSSTVHGYEGTGRSLSLKLLHDLRGAQSSTTTLARSLREVTLDEPIRYSRGDGVESWLHRLLCLDATVPTPLSSKDGLATPSRCGLYLVNRRALFSYHSVSEQFLHRLMSLFVSSHYKNSPNDLLLLADAPAHYVFVLLPPVEANAEALPDVYCAIQVSVEGAISKDTLKAKLAQGVSPAGDLIPWTLSQYFVDEDFGSLTGARVVRLATHPSLQRMGYGSEAIKQLIEYFEGRGMSIEEPLDQDVVGETRVASPRSHSVKKSKGGKIPPTGTSDSISTLRSEKLECAADLPPLLTACSDTQPTHAIQYIGSCFGLTFDLFKFWVRRGFKSVYIRHTKNDITGEHSAILLRPIANAASDDVSDNWLRSFAGDFRARLVNLLGSAFGDIETPLAVALLEPPTKKAPKDDGCENTLSPSGLPIITISSLHQFLTSHDINRLKKYSQQLADESLIADLLPPISWLFFNGRLPGLTLSYLQCAVLLALGCQRRSACTVAKEFEIPTNQAMALFKKAIHRIIEHIQGMQEKQVQDELKVSGLSNQVVSTGESIGDEPELPTKSFEKELDEGAAVISLDVKKQRETLLKALKTEKSLQKYSMEGLPDNAFDEAVKVGSGKVSLKRKRPN